MDIDETLDTIGTKATEVKDSLMNQGENVKGRYNGCADCLFVSF